MSDIRIINVTNLDGIWADWLLKPDGSLDESEELVNIVKVALLTDALATLDDVLPDPDSDDRRGWWGDLDAVPLWNGWPIGSSFGSYRARRSRQRKRAKARRSSAPRPTAASRFKPMITNRLCSAFDVVATRIGLERIDVLITVYRGPQQAIELQFQNLWTGIRT